MKRMVEKELESNDSKVKEVMGEAYADICDMCNEYTNNPIVRCPACYQEQLKKGMIDSFKVFVNKMFEE